MTRPPATSALLLQFFIDLFQDAGITPPLLDTVSDRSRLRDFTLIHTDQAREILDVTHQVYREDPDLAIDKGLRLHSDYCNTQFAWFLTARHVPELLDRFGFIDMQNQFDAQFIDSDTLKFQLNDSTKVDDYNLLFGLSAVLGLLRDATSSIEVDLHCASRHRALGVRLRDRTQCNLKLDASTPYLVLHAPGLSQRSLVTRNDALSAILQPRSQLDSIDLGHTGHVADVVAVIRRELHDPDFSMRDLAAELNTSLRSLQRRLKEENLSFRQLMKRERQRRAIELIDSGKHDRSAIVTMVGYRELSSLYRLMRTH